MTRPADAKEGVVDRIVLWLGAVLAAHVLELVDTPAQGGELLGHRYESLVLLDKKDSTCHGCTSPSDGIIMATD